MSKSTSSRPIFQIIFVGSEKGGIGKSFVIATTAALLEIDDRPFRIVQIDDQDRLTRLYNRLVTTVTPARLDDLRRDPAAIVHAFDPLYAAIERTIDDRVTTLIDVGGMMQGHLENYLSLVDLDSDLVEADIATLWLVPTTAEPEAMRGAVRTAAAVGRVLPSATRKIVLNGRDGPFKFYPASPADELWHKRVEPLCTKLGSVDLPAIAAGSWIPFETAGKRFVEVATAEIEDIRDWTGRSRPAAKVLRGDVAAFLAAAEAALEPLLGIAEEAGHVG